MYLKTVTIRGEGAQLLESTFSIIKGPLFNTVLKCQGMHARWLSGYSDLIPAIPTLIVMVIIIII